MFLSRLGLAVLAATLSTAAFAQSRYTIERLGAVANTFPQSRGFDVTDSGQVLGYTNRPSVGQTATVFPPNTGTPPLYTLPVSNPGSSALYRGNESGLAVGYGSLFPGDRAAYWRTGDTELTQLPSLVAAGSTSQAADVNESGVIVGRSANGANQTRPVVWSSTAAAAPTLLNGLTGGTGTAGVATGVNDAGVVVGNFANNSNVRRITRWTPGAGGTYSDAEDLTALALTNGLSDLATASGGLANAINTRGDIVGSYVANSGTGNITLGFYYNALANNFSTLGRVAANDATLYANSVLRDVNDSGVAVGNFGDGTSNGERAAVWLNGVAFNLNGADASATPFVSASDLAAANITRLIYAQGINNQGWITGYGLSGGDPSTIVGFLLKPSSAAVVPEAGTAALVLSAGCFVLSAAIVRRKSGRR